MKTQADKSSNLPLLITGIAVILFSTAGIAPMMGWGPNSTDDSGLILALDHSLGAKARCAGCGTIESIREIDSHGEFNDLGAVGTAAAGEYARVKSNKSYAIAVRLFDGSSRVINDASPASWRLGEFVIVIDGANRSNR